MLMQVVTTNRNRIVSEIRHLMSKNGGNMAETGAVGWMFHRKGEIMVAKEAADEDKMMDIVLDAGAEDLQRRRLGLGSDHSARSVRKSEAKLCSQAGITPTSAEVGLVPQNYVKLSGAAGARRWCAWSKRWKNTTTCSTFTPTST